MQGKNCPTCGASPGVQKRKIRGTRDISTWGYVADLNPVDGVECPSCRFCFVVEEFDTDEGGMILSDDVMFACIPNYCPRCGQPIPDKIKGCA